MPLSFDIKQHSTCRFVVTITQANGQKIIYKVNTLKNCFKRLYEYTRDHLEETLG